MQSMTYKKQIAKVTGVFLQILPYVLHRHILSILPVVLILASFTHPWPRHQYQPPLPEAARFLKMQKKKKENSTLGISKQPRLQTHKKRMRSKKDVGLPEINGLLYAFHAILETFHCKECDGPSNQQHNMMDYDQVQSLLNFWSNQHGLFQGPKHLRNILNDTTCKRARHWTGGKLQQAASHCNYCVSMYELKKKDSKNQHAIYVFQAKRIIDCIDSHEAPSKYIIIV